MRKNDEVLLYFIVFLFGYLSQLLCSIWDRHDKIQIRCQEDGSVPIYDSSNYKRCY